MKHLDELVNAYTARQVQEGRRQAETGRWRPQALVQAINEARTTLEIERITGIQMPDVVHFDLLHVLNVARSF